jgi:murein DD-endopeptidase MepM/ murein hydrolase activator NlpD
VTSGSARARGLRGAGGALDQSAPFAFLSTDAVPQAGSFSLHVRRSGAASGTATFNGRQYRLFPDGDYLVAVIGAGQAIADQIELDTGNYQVKVSATDSSGRALSFNLPITVLQTDFPVDAITIPPDQAATLLQPSVAADELTRLAAIYKPVTDSALWQGLFRWPVQGPITTQFGEARSYNGGPVTGHHAGVDIGCDEGTPVAVGAAGTVVFAGQMSERGNFVAVDHGWGVFSGYAHLSKITTVVGTPVQMGMVIGLAGQTGLSTGPHLHWECCIYGVHVDAMRWTYTLLP